MPRVVTPVPETYESIVRPVTMEVVRQVCALLSLPSNIQIQFPGAVESVPMTGSTLQYNGEPSQFNNDERVNIEVSEELVEEQVLGTSVFKQENIPCFVDGKLETFLWPVYSGTELVINFTYRAANRTTAERFRHEALVKTAQGRSENFHEINYHYPIPYEYVHLLKHIHTLRETQGGYGQDFDAWMRNCLSKKATTLSTVIGTETMLVIAENQIRPLGRFDFAAAPQPAQKEDNAGAYTLNFSYRLYFDKVIAVASRYPLVVHNQLIDEGWYSKPLPSGFVRDPERRYGAGAFGRYVLDYFAGMNQHVCAPPPETISIPEFDEWSAATSHPSTVALVNIMLAVDPDDLNAVIDLKEMGDFNIEPAVLEFLKTEAPYLNKYTHSVVHLALYRGDVPVEDGSLLIDSNLIVRSNRPLDIRANYHLRVSLMYDLNLLSAAAFERFRSSGQACLNILSTLQWTLLRDGFLPQLLGGKYVARSELQTIARRILSLRHPQHGPSLAMQTVGNFLIVTHKRTDYADHAAQTERPFPEGYDSGAGGRTPLSAEDTDC